MNRTLSARLDKHFVGASALAAAAGFAGSAQQAEAGIVYSGPVNINIPSTTAGVYLNVVTGVNNTSPAAVPGWDVNPWSSGGLNMFSQTGGGHVSTGGTGSYDNLTPGTVISSASAFSAVGTATINAATPLNLNSSNNIVGFRFLNEGTNTTNYGWMRISLGATAGGQPRAIVEYAYEDSGLEIAAGATSSGPTGACCVPSTLSCVVVSSSGCASLGGTYRGDTTTCASANCPTPGACCKPDGTCAQTTSAGCTTLNGVYRGDSTACATAACPGPGACCTANGVCNVVTSSACASSSGIYRGDGTTCANANCPGGFSMDCNATGTFTDISGIGTAITTGDDSAGAFTSSVTNALVTNANLFACTNGFISDSATFTAFTNTALPATGATFALFPNWDDLYIDTTLATPGSLVHAGVVENGVNVEIIQWNMARTFTAQTGNPQGSFQVKIFASGPVLAQYIYQGMGWDWNGNSSTVGLQWGANAFYQKQFLNSNTTPTPPFPIPDNTVCNIVQNAVGSTCYPNCDGSTGANCLNVLDFGCFLNKFAAGDTYANCDHSTNPPVLNVLDFGCFLNSFAAGCSSC